MSQFLSTRLINVSRITQIETVNNAYNNINYDMKITNNIKYLDKIKYNNFYLFISDFIRLFYSNSDVNIKIKQIKILYNNNRIINKFNKNKNKQKIKSGITFKKLRGNYNENENNIMLSSICVSGLKPMNIMSNKGTGIYTSSHTNYTIDWGGDRNDFLICDTIFDKNNVKAYRSEIPPGQEYKIHSSDYILPLFAISYEIVERKYITSPTYGFSGCEKCDYLKILCNCEIPLYSYINNTSTEYNKILNSYKCLR